MKRAAIYARVSTEDQNCERQLLDLEAFAGRLGCEVISIYTETASGKNNGRKERAKIIALAQARKIDCVLVTELTRWGRSTVDLLETLQDLNKFGVSLIAQTGNQFDLSTAQGKMIAGVLAVLAEFERDLLSERTKSGLAAARARGKKLGRPNGNRTIKKHRKEVEGYLAEGKPYRWIAERLGISTRTITDIAR